MDANEKNKANIQIQDYGLKESIEESKDDLSFLDGIGVALEKISLMHWSGKNGSVYLKKDQHDYIVEIEELVRNLKNKICEEDNKFIANFKVK